MNRLRMLRHCLRKTQLVAGEALDNTERVLFPVEQIRQDIAFMRQMLDRAEYHLDVITRRRDEAPQ